MDEAARAEFKREFNTAVGSLLSSIRQKAGFSLEQVADSYAKSRLEKVKRLENGIESLHGKDLMELVQLYGSDYAEISISIYEIAEKARKKFSLPKSLIPNANHQSKGTAPPASPPNAN